MPKEIPPPRESGFTTTTPVPLYWAAYGPRGAPRLLVLHGGPGAHHDYLLPQMLELARDYELIFYDQRGGGRSKDDGRTPITWRTQVSDLALVAHELGGPTLSLVGYSWGGLLAMLYAIDVFGGGDPPLPAPLASARPHGAHLAGADHARVPRGLRGRARRAPGELARWTSFAREVVANGLRERDHAGYRQRLFEISVAGYFADIAARARPHPLPRHRPRASSRSGRASATTIITAELARIACPVLIVHGREDPIPVESSQVAAKAIPDARLEVLDGSGHVPYVEAGPALFAALQRFLAETELVTSG